MRLFQNLRSAKTQISAATPNSITQRPSQPADWANLDDRELCQKLNIGTRDEQSRAFSALYDRYELMIRNYVMKQLNYSEEDSLEVIGDTWLVFWRERMKFTWRDDAEADNPFQSWLYGIARNRVKSKVRQNQKERENIASVPLDQVSSFIESRLADSSINGASTNRTSGIDKPELETLSNRHFNLIMKQLNPTEQKIVTLRYYKSLTYAEISQQMGKTSAAVRTAHTRLIQKLRQKLDAPYLDPHVDNQSMEK